MRWTPNLTVRSFRTCSRPQQKSDRWIGQYSLLRSLMGTSLWDERYSPGALAGTSGRPFAHRTINAELRRRVIITGLLRTLGSACTRDNSEGSRRKHFDDWSYRDTERLAGRTRDSPDPVEAIGRCGYSASRPYPPEFIAPIAAGCYDATPISSRSSPPDRGSAKSTVVKVEV